LGHNLLAIFKKDRGMLPFGQTKKMSVKSNPARGRSRKFFLLPLAVVLATAGAGGAYALNLVVHHNFHAVTAGQVYRSGQMTGEQLADAIQRHGIKTVINLRGENGNQDWYLAETGTAQRLGVQHVDFALSAGQEVKDEEMDRILAAIQAAPKPLLIHCKSGSDRTGLVGALYLYSLEGQTARAAGHELSARYGHFPYLFWRDTIAMDRSFDRYVSNHTQRTGLPGPRPPALAGNPGQ
jgi:protein tyrosine/serine phosphatase